MEVFILDGQQDEVRVIGVEQLVQQGQAILVQWGVAEHIIIYNHILRFICGKEQADKIHLIKISYKGK
jgi:hypothetical protein